MACFLMPESNFLQRYLQCLLPEETLDVEVKITTMKGIHTFRKDCTTQIIMCKPWSPRLSPYPSLAQKMQTYLELKDPKANHPCSSPNHPDKPNTPSPQKAKLPRGPANEKQKRRNRSKQANRRQFKVRQIKKPLFPSIIVMSTRSDTMTTSATVTQSTRTNPIIKSMMWPTAKTTMVPLSIYNVPSARVQKISDSPMPKPCPKPQGRESTPIPVHTISPMEQQPATLIHKTIVTAVPAILPVCPLHQEVQLHGPIPFWPQPTCLLPGHGHYPLTRMTAQYHQHKRRRWNQIHLNPIIPKEDNYLPPTSFSPRKVCYSQWLCHSPHCGNL